MKALQITIDYLEKVRDNDRLEDWKKLYQVYQTLYELDKNLYEAKQIILDRERLISRLSQELNQSKQELGNLDLATTVLEDHLEKLTKQNEELLKGI